MFIGYPFPDKLNNCLQLLLSHFKNIRKQYNNKYSNKKMLGTVKAALFFLAIV